MDDELGAADRAALDAHVSGCPICAGMLVELRKLRIHFAALPELAIGTDLAPLVDQRIAAPARAAKPRGRPPRVRWWQIALAAPGAAFALAAGAYLGSVLMLGAGIAAEPEALQMAAFSATPPGALCPTPLACNGRTR
jgi:anti-sigma factor RsiW